jgi:ribose transport system ATP-binding protein
MQGITKRFPGVLALRGVSLSLAAGEVLALMGENGAGKSTLMKILGGTERPDEGQIVIDGRPVELSGVREARRLGIALIHQELMLTPNLDIAANIFLGNEPQGAARSKGADPNDNEARGVGGSLLRPLPRAAMNARAAALLARVGLNVPPATPVSALTAGQMQLVEIAKALSQSARILIMDEPTSSLTVAESERLFRIIRQLRAEGIAVIYISHRIAEVLDLADRLTVLRDGCHAGDLGRSEATHDKIVSMMVGRVLSQEYFPAKEPRPPGEIVLAVDGVLVPGAPAGVSFTARRGEILGFAGLVGAGRTELMETIFGVTAASGGAMTLEGRAFSPRHPRDAIAHGVFLAPEDRKRHGLVLPMSVAQNTSLPSVASYNRWGWLDRVTERRVAEDQAARLRTKTPSIHQKVVNLSGGNQQKVVLGKWLAMNPRVLILDEPTRGIDVGAKAEIYHHMAALTAQGIAILLVSSDLEEIVGVSDRVVVMHERRIQGVLPRENVTPERIARLMMGRGEEDAA